MIDDASAGNKIFYDFYTEAQKNADPTKWNAGLFFFRGKPGAPFTRCGAVRQVREWLPPSAPTEPHSMGVTLFRVHRLC